MTPDGNILTLQFQEIRKREKLSPCYKDTVPGEFGMEFSMADLKNYIAGSTINIQCALSLCHEQYFLAPYWSNQSENTKADFHQPSKFWQLTLTK